MKLIVKCKDCHNEIRTPHKASSRINYLKKHGEQFNLTCQNCNRENVYEVDDIRAVNYSFGELIINRIAVIIITLILAFILGFFLFGPTGAIMISVILTFVVALIAKKNNSKSNLTFNKHKVSGRMSNIGG